MSERKLYKLVVRTPMLYGTEDDVHNHFDMLPPDALIKVIEIKSSTELSEEDFNSSAYSCAYDDEGENIAERHDCLLPVDIVLNNKVDEYLELTDVIEK